MNGSLNFWIYILYTVLGLLLFSNCEIAIGATPIKSTIDSEEDMVSLDSAEPIELRDFIKKISVLIHKNVIIDNKALGQVQILAPRKVSRGEAYEIFLSALDYLSLGIVEIGSLIRIQPKREALVGSYAPVVTTGSVQYSDRVYTQIFPLHHVRAEYMRNTLAFIVSSSSLIAYEPSNSIILTDTGNNLRKVAEFLEIVDRPDSVSNREFIHLKYTSAGEIGKLILDLFKGETNLSGDALKVITIETSNSLFLTGPVEKIRRAREAIEEFDKPLQEGEADRNGIFVRPLMFSDAKKLASLLNAIAPQEKTESAQGVVRKKQNLQIVADEATNSLLFKGSLSAYRSMNGIVRRLDEAKAQVFVECEILSVSEENNFSFLPSLLAGSGKSDGADVKTIVGYQASAMTPLIVAQATNTTNSIGSTQAKSVVSTFSRDMTVGVFPGGSVGLPGLGKISPGALVTLMKTDVYSRVLSSPKLLIMDNEEGNLSVGETLLFRSSKPDSSGNMTESIEKENVDITLKLKPSMTGSNALNLMIEVETNSVFGFADGGMPQIAKRKARQLVNFKNGQTVLISGIQNMSRSNTEKKVPLLGSIPVLGYLFQSKSVENRNNFTFIFLTAHIMRGAEDLQILFEKRFKEMNPRKTGFVMGSSDMDGQGG
jgi:general secretion pathway protein D